MAILAVASESSIHTWDYRTSERKRFEPLGTALITDLAWNHNGQGEHDANERDAILQSCDNVGNPLIPHNFSAGFRQSCCVFFVTKLERRK